MKATQMAEMARVLGDDGHKLPDEAPVRWLRLGLRGNPKVVRLANQDPDSAMAVPCEEGTEVTVRWPDGSTSVETIVMRPQPTDARLPNLPHFRVTVRGLAVDVALWSVEILASNFVEGLVQGVKQNAQAQEEEIRARARAEEARLRAEIAKASNP